MKKIRKRMVRKKNIGAYQGRHDLSIVLSSPAATSRLGARLAVQRGPVIWLLSGPVGAGKTTLVRGALRALGIRGRVASPTFTLVHHYRSRRLWRRVVHVDAYRVKSRHEFAALDITAAIEDEKTLVLIEWPERLGRRWPAGCLRLRFRHLHGGREVRLRRT